ncbi:MAG: hypothetical protein U0599_02895 [Vicinamibacteria bacterium]
MSPHRVVALGASNLTRGFRTVVAAAREAWGPDVEVLAALGHGRSYGGESRFLGRVRPGILQSGLWSELARRPAAPTRAILTDVGNDVAYGHGAERTLAWVEECLDRLAPHTRDVTLTDLPMASLRRLSPAKYLAFRTVLVPSCRLPLARVLDEAQRVSDGLVALAARRSLRLVRVRPEWYGFDPIHVKRRLWRAAWREILLGDHAPAPSSAPARTSRAAAAAEALRLYRLRPERSRVLGRERLVPQAGLALPAGGRIWSY